MLNNKDTLLEVIDEIMTDMFFIFPDMDDEGRQITEGTVSDKNIKIRIHFHTNYELQFDIDKSLLEEMASNFMGLTEDMIENSHLESMAQETANIIGGNFLVKMDPEREFNLSIPHIVEESVDTEEAPWSTCFVAESGIMRITPIKRNTN